MSHGALVRNPVTNWTDGSTILAAELTTLDANLTSCVSAGDLGATVWLASKVFALGALVVPPANNGLVYVASAITTGESGASAPVWPTTIGGSIVDSGVTWTCTATVAGLPTTSGGGCWAPAGLITISGAGLRCDGPLLVTRGGVLNCAQGYIQLDAPSSQKLGPTHSGRTRKIVQAFAEGTPVPRAMWRPRRDTGGMQSLAPMYQLWTAANPAPAVLGLPIRGHQGATLSSVTIGFRVATPHTTLPTKMPAFRMLRVGADGVAVPMTSIAAGADALGFMYVTKPASTAAWYNNGLGQTFTFNCDQNNVVDRTTSTILLEVQEEQGLIGWPWVTQIMQPVLALAYGLGALSGLTAFDGITPVDGSRVLVLDNADVSQNGIWIAHSGDWTRSNDLSQASQFYQGFIVGVQQGLFYGGAYFQPSTNTVTWSPGTTPPGTAVWQAVNTYSTLRWPVSPVHNNGYWFEVTTTGVSGGSEPAWNTSPGGTTPDGSGSLVWTCIGPTATPLTFVTRPNADTAPAGTALVSAGNIFQAAQIEYTNISDLAFQ